MIVARGLFASAVLLLAACSSNGSNDEPVQKATSLNINTLPTSALCARAGGVTTVAHSLNGDAVKMCQMPNGKRCEEWALGQGACSAAG
ncbi:putative hemolysin [Gibbsiella quercinecans]|uniref:Hemolysin n=1 Tax=Gibbsiella quercinecans TaxID=929813 RepID=A0A250B7G9_9GAMM|nr:DUF333 domain-containing protein [Gibbsiella quercinecans]ATA22180.1 hypothetical protein AWC35_24180 [Gibbsiella quercinecans]RLM07029.1 hypothetical protein BIY30_15010 [Gibbsiella quercinecans]RLM09252.1 hypothetical protein BIY31_09765 [Gibbsiella quercinecans]TCT84029.1 putative hemolysin [Gibbsiella quercinecans]